MSSQQKDSNKRKRLSLQGTPPAQPTAQPMMQLVPWMANQMWNPAMWMQQGTQQPMAMMAPGPSTSSGTGHSQSRKKEAGSSSDSSGDEELRPKKRRQSAGKKVSKPKQSGERIGRGRPSREQVEGRERILRGERIVKNYPPAFEGPDSIAILKKDECCFCTFYIGHVLIKPCGHAKCCQTCINRLRKESVQMMRPAKCPANECFEVMESWITLHHVSD